MVSIIVLLLGILLPTLGRAREQARTTVCLANLHQIGVAETAYLTEYESYLLAGYANPAVVFSNGYNADVENYATLLVNGGFLTAPLVQPASSSAADLGVAPVAKGASVFRCPSGAVDRIAMCFSDPVLSLSPDPAPASRTDPISAYPWRSRSLTTGIVVDTWYAINAVMFDFDFNGSPARRIPDQNSGSQVVLKLSQLRNPSITVYLADGIFTHFFFAPDRIAARHAGGTKTNITFYDGSARTVDTVAVPGGLGPSGTGSPAAAFSLANLQNYSDILFRYDQ